MVLFQEDGELYSVQSSESTIVLHDDSRRKSQTITDMLMEKCPKDLSCIIRSIQKSPRMPGNIAMVVDLLHNISTALTREVNEEKMRVSGLADQLALSLWGRNLG